MGRMGELLGRLRLQRVERAIGAQGARLLYVVVNSALTVGLLATVAHLFDAPFVFPSLGPTAYLMFHRPSERSASPRNTIWGHAIGAGVGLLALTVFGLTDEPSALQHGVDWPRVGAAALALGGTGGLMVLLDASHPPAGATTLIVALGIMVRPSDLLVLMAAVLGLVALSLAINRLAGLPYPVWSEPPGTPIK